MTHEEKVIKKMSLALKESGLFGPEAIEMLKKAKISDKAIVASIEQAKLDMNPPQPKPEIEYVVGFAFNPEKTHVLLMWKDRPLWQKGKLNGIGGVVREGESLYEAMIRKFKDETSMNTDFDMTDEKDVPTWMYVGKRYREAVFDSQPGSFTLHIFGIWLGLEEMRAIARAEQRDEVVVCLPINMEILRRRGVPGLAWTADAALSSLIEGFHIHVEDPAHLPTFDDDEN